MAPQPSLDFVYDRLVAAKGRKSGTKFELLRDPERLKAIGYVSMPTELNEEMQTLAHQAGQVRDSDTTQAVEEDL